MSAELQPRYQNTPCGFLIFPLSSMAAFESALTYEPGAEDLFVVTYPKCGTTWVQNIVAGILKGGRTFQSAVEFFTEAVYLEMAGAEAVKNMKRPGAIKTHLPFEFVPWSDQAKYIVVIRNPKDCCVSLFHHTRNFPAYKFKNGKFDVFFERFMRGNVDYGDYFDWILSWYERRSYPNVLLITYEDIKKDTRKNVLKIAEFIDIRYREMLEENEEMLKDVLKGSSFDTMKQNLDRQVAELAAVPAEEINKSLDLPPTLKQIFGSEEPFFDKGPDAISYCRKGEVGDWKNLLSPEQSRIIDERFAERAEGTDLFELWTDVL